MQRYAPEGDGKNGLQGSTIPLSQRTRKFRVPVPAVDREEGRPAYNEFEMRDLCFFSPNQLMSCGRPAYPSGWEYGPSITHQDALDNGGYTRCEQTFEQYVPPGHDVTLPLSGQYNHRYVDSHNGEPLKTHTDYVPWPPGGHWSRPPHPWEAAEHVTPAGPGTEPKLPG